MDSRVMELRIRQRITVFEEQPKSGCILSIRNGSSSLINENYLRSKLILPLIARFRIFRTLPFSMS